MTDEPDHDALNQSVLRDMLQDLDREAAKKGGLVVDSIRHMLQTIAKDPLQAYSSALLMLRMTLAFHARRRELADVERVAKSRLDVMADMMEQKYGEVRLDL